MRRKIILSLLMLSLILIATVGTGAYAAGFSSHDRYAWDFKTSPAAWTVIHRFYKKTIK